MRSELYLNPVIYNLNIEKIATYLQYNNWRSIIHPNKKYRVFTNTVHDDSIELVIPSQMCKSNIDKFISIIETIATLEDREPLMVLMSIIGIVNDVLIERVPGYQVNDNTIPLSLAYDMVSSLRETLKSAACTEENPVPYYKRSTLKSREFVERCRFGHTFRGSFGFTVESPLYLVNQQLSTGIAQEPPFERRVMERIIRGMSIVQSASTSGDIEEITENFKIGLNANICDAILNSANSMEMLQVEYNVNWSPLWEVSKDIKNIKSICLDNRALECIAVASDSMREEVEPKTVKIIGHVVGTRFEGPKDEEDEEKNKLARKIYIKYLNEDSRMIEVALELNSSDYVKASNANIEWNMITVTGELGKEGRKWVLMNPREFKVLNFK